MKTYRNDQLEAHQTEVSDIAIKVARNVGGIKLIVSPIRMTVILGDLSHVLDVGDEYSFFYSNEADALLDQAVLTNALRTAGVSVSKVHRNEPFTLTQ